ncbi:MAG: PEGA domain-containing protein [Planctomycetales bacterium]|nr:PEGA domain-containing protein [Planctomycetales bacterium]
MRFRILVIFFVAMPCVCGCVRRRMTVRSNPPGALVYIDDQEIGKTPVSTSFTYYGTRKIRLARDGFETETVMQKVKPPWYQIPPLDFISENLYPGELRDERILDFDLSPQQVSTREELLGRANDLRSASRVGYAVPSPEVRDDFDDRPLPRDDSGISDLQDEQVPPAFYP